MSLYEFEHAKRAELGIKYICGVDEAGRGPLAGPVFAAAVILPEDFEIEGLNDSKKLSEKSAISFLMKLLSTHLHILFRRLIIKPLMKSIF